MDDELSAMPVATSTPEELEPPGQRPFPDGRSEDAGSDTRAPIEVCPHTIRQAADALFILWLKIAATLLAWRFVALVWPVVILLILSLMLVATFNPLVRRLQQRLTRASAIAVVVFGLIATCGGLLVMIIPPLVRQARNLLTDLPQHIKQIESAAGQMGIKLRLSGSNLDLSHQAASLPETWNVLLTVFNGVTGVLTVAVLTTYLLIDGPRVSTSVLRLLPKRQRLLIRQMFGEIGAQVGDYMRGQLITSGLAGAFSFVVLLALGVPEPLALAFWMALADAVPMVGPLIGTAPAVLMALTQSTTNAIIVLVAYVLYHQIESHILVPRIYGKTMKLAPSIIVIAILVGATLMGVLGALIALPVAAAVPVILRYVEEWRQREEDEEENAEADLRSLP